MGEKVGPGRDSGTSKPLDERRSWLQIDAFDTDPYVMMPYNPPDYPRYAEEAGYEKVKDLYAYIFERDWDVGERIGRLAAKVRRRYEPKVRSVNMKNFDAELDRLKKLYNEAWDENWGFLKYTDAEFDQLASELKLIVDPELILFVEMEEKPAGVALCLPDANQIFKRAHGRLFPFGLLAFLNRKKIVDQLRLVILGLEPEYRNKGLEVVLIDELYRRAMAKGYRSCECSWVLEDNHAIIRGIEASGAKLYKAYRIYQKDL